MWKYKDCTDKSKETFKFVERKCLRPDFMCNTETIFFIGCEISILTKFSGEKKKVGFGTNVYDRLNFYILKFASLAPIVSSPS